MAKQRYVNTHFWDDGFITSLDPIEKLLFIYCLTNPLTEISGAYEIPLRRIAFDTGIDGDMVIKILQRFADEDKIIYKDNWLFICNFIKHQVDSEKINTGIETLIKSAPEWVIDRVRISYGYRIGISSHLNSNSNRDSNRDSKNGSDEPKPRKPPAVKQTQSEWLVAIRTEPLYAHINLDYEIAKAEKWIRDNPPRQFTKKFLSRWLNKIDPPLPTNGNGHRPTGCDICLNHPWRKRLNIVGGQIYDESTKKVVPCICAK